MHLDIRITADFMANRIRPKFEEETKLKRAENCTKCAFTLNGECVQDQRDTGLQGGCMYGWDGYYAKVRMEAL